jgi:hypothetical protein
MSSAALLFKYLLSLDSIVGPYCWPELPAPCTPNDTSFLGDVVHHRDGVAEASHAQELRPSVHDAREIVDKPSE